VLSCPLIILTLGFFLLFINGAMLLLADRLAGAFGVGFHVRDFAAAFWGALVISVVSFGINLFLGEERERQHH
jgi:putative membrane protein